jgi:hypothetical protein
MERQNKKIKAVIENVRSQTEQEGIMLDDLEKTDRRQIVSKNVRVQTKQIRSKDVDTQTELKTITLDYGEAIGRPHVLSEEVEAKSDSSHQFDTTHPNLNGHETPDQGQVVVVVQDSDNVVNVSMTTNRRVVEATTEERNLTTTNIVDDIIADPGPVVGYAEEPLLSLSKACVPLTDILHDLGKYVQIALIETPDVPPDGLTVDESAAIRLYTIEWEGPHRSLYAMLNFTLKTADREQLRPYFKYLKLFLTGLVKLPCVPQLTVWRGVTKNLSAEFPPGTPVTWWAFSSTTTEMTVLENNMYLGNTGSRTLFSVEAINGRTIRAHSHFVTEDEILLLPGTRMIVQSQFSPASDLHIIHLKQVIPEEMLLEPPFEGIFNIFNHLF